MAIFGMNKKDSLDYIDKEGTIEMRGLGMILIILAHAMGGKSNFVTFFFYASAILGVSICFFVSGYGLYKSYISKTQYLKHFLPQKISKILVPYVILFILVIVVKFIKDKRLNTDDILHDILRLQLNGLLLWYLKIQLLCYLLFFLGFHCPSKYRIASVFILELIYVIICWKSGAEEYWYNTCLFFPIGLLFAKYENKLLPIIRVHFTIIGSLLLFVLIFAIIFFKGRMGVSYIIDPLYMLSFLILSISFFRHYTGSFLLHYLGSLSMEVYLVHLLLLQSNVFGIFDASKGYMYLLIIILSLLLSWPLNCIDNQVAKFFSSKTRFI